MRVLVRLFIFGGFFIVLVTNGFGASFQWLLAWLMLYLGKCMYDGNKAQAPKRAEIINQVNTRQNYKRTVR